MSFELLLLLGSRALQSKSRRQSPRVRIMKLFPRGCAYRCRSSVRPLTLPPTVVRRLSSVVSRASRPLSAVVRTITDVL